jgi:hypothetical protein
VSPALASGLAVFVALSTAVSVRPRESRTFVALDPQVGAWLRHLLA